MGKAASLKDFKVNRGGTSSTSPAKPEKKVRKKKMVRKMFVVSEDGAKQFAILKAEAGKKGPELIAEALNLLFEKYERPPVA